MYKDDEIDWNTLRTELTEYIHIPQETKLPPGIFVCPECDGSGRVTVAYRDPGPNRMGKCHICEGTGKIKRCVHKDCKRPISTRDLSKLCIVHEEERRDKIVKEILDRKQNV